MDGKELFCLLKKALGAETDPDYSKWIPVSKLKPEDITRMKNFHSNAMKLTGDAEVAISKLKAIKAQVEALESEWWEHLHQTYNLPRKKSWHILDDGTILKKPDGESSCVCGQCK